MLARRRRRRAHHARWTHEVDLDQAGSTTSRERLIAASITRLQTRGLIAFPVSSLSLGLEKLSKSLIPRSNCPFFPNRSLFCLEYIPVFPVFSSNFRLSRHRKELEAGKRVKPPDRYGHGTAGPCPAKQRHRSGGIASMRNELMEKIFGPLRSEGQARRIIAHYGLTGIRVVLHFIKRSGRFDPERDSSTPARLRQFNQSVARL